MARVTNTKDGAITQTFKTPGKVPIRNLKISFTPRQQGTGDPSPTNIRAINGYTGFTDHILKSHENLYDYSTATVVTGHTRNSSGSEATSTSNFYISTYYPVVPGSLISLNLPEYTNVIRIYHLNSSKEWISRSNMYAGYGVMEYVPNDCAYVQFQCSNSMLDHLQKINLVNLLSLPVSWEPEAGTIYGGSFDFVTGELINEWRTITCTASTPVYSTGDSTVTPGVSWSCQRISASGANVGITTPNDGDDNGFYSVGDWRKGAVVGRNRAYYSGNYVYITNISSDYDMKTAAGRTAFYNDISGSAQIVYKLATPVTVATLTPQELFTEIGYNMVTGVNGISNTKIIYDYAESIDMLMMRKEFIDMIMRTSMGDPIPAGVEIGLFTPTENETTHTITHSLGEVPKIAYCFSVINGAWTSLPSSTIAVNEFISDPETGVFDPSLAGSHKRDNVIQPSTDILTATTTYTTYPASMTSTQVTFATGRYYSGRFTQGTQYIYILIK